MRRAKIVAAVASFLSAGFLQSQTPPPQATPSIGNAQQTATPPRRNFEGAGRNYSPSDPDAIERGHKQFVATCAFCHGSNAKGGESGPDLLRSVLVLDDDHGDKIGPVVLNGRPDKGMPKFSLTPDQIADISAFLLDRVKAAALRGTYKILDIVVGNPKAGQTYFNGAGRCASCHYVTGDLAHVGSKYDAVTIQQLIVMPRQGRGGFMQPPRLGNPAAAVTVTVTLRSGQSFTGRVDHIDDFGVALTDSNGDYHSFTRDGDDPKVEIHDPLRAHTELLSKYTDRDIHDLTAYLVSVK